MSNIDVRGNIVDEKVAHDSVQYSSTGPRLVLLSPLTYPRLYTVAPVTSCIRLGNKNKTKQSGRRFRLMLQAHSP